MSKQRSVILIVLLLTSLYLFSVEAKKTNHKALSKKSNYLNSIKQFFGIKLKLEDENDLKEKNDTVSQSSDEISNDIASDEYSEDVSPDTIDTSESKISNKKQQKYLDQDSSEMKMSLENINRVNFDEITLEDKKPLNDAMKNIKNAESSIISENRDAIKQIDNDLKGNKDLLSSIEIQKHDEIFKEYYKSVVDELGFQIEKMKVNNVSPEEIEEFKQNMNEELKKIIKSHENKIKLLISKKNELQKTLKQKIKDKKDLLNAESQASLLKMKTYDENTLNEYKKVLLEQNYALNKAHFAILAKYREIQLRISENLKKVTEENEKLKDSIKQELENKIASDKHEFEQAMSIIEGRDKEKMKRLLKKFQEQLNKPKVQPENVPDDQESESDKESPQNLERKRFSANLTNTGKRKMDVPHRNIEKSFSKRLYYRKHPKRSKKHRRHYERGN